MASSPEAQLDPSDHFAAQCREAPRRDRGAALELLQLLAGLLGGYLCERDAAAHQNNGGDQTLRF